MWAKQCVATQNRRGFMGVEPVATTRAAGDRSPVLASPSASPVKKQAHSAPSRQSSAANLVPKASSGSGSLNSESSDQPESLLQSNQPEQLEGSSKSNSQLPQSRSDKPLLWPLPHPQNPLYDFVKAYNAVVMAQWNAAQHQAAAKENDRADAAPGVPPPQYGGNPWDFTGSFGSIPSPSNLPVNEDYLSRAAQSKESSFRAARGMWTMTDQPGIDLFLAGPCAWSKLSQVYVILFGVGNGTEGIYSLRAFSSEGLPCETIITFECEEDAHRYASLLEATMTHKPNVYAIPPRELLDFCMEQNYNCRMEPQGSLLIPPDYNVHVTDWERALRLRKGEWSVLEHEPHGNQGQTQTQARPTMSATQPVLTRTGVNPGTLAKYQGFSDSDLETIKARLEKLLPSEE